MNALKDKILKLKQERNAVILAHFYQEAAIQELADFVGDSLALSQKAAQIEAPVIVFAGVHFMAETAKILNPGRKILVPDLNAGCSLADSCSPEAFRAFITANPNCVVVTYINCSAEIKAMSDYVCTSSNARQIIEDIPTGQQIIFAPDRNLGRYLNQITGRDMLLWDGACVVHEAFSLEKLISLHKQYPQAQIIAHPESEQPILQTAAFIGSTAAMIDFVKHSPRQAFIVATEASILYKMQQEVPGKLLIPAPAKQENNCACSECAYMKVNTLQKLYDCLLHEAPEILVADDLRLRALVPIERMLAHSR